MNHQTARLSAKAGSPERAEGRSKRDSMKSMTLSSIGGWMVLIAVLAILLAAAIEVIRGSALLLLIIAVPLLVALPSRTHLCLALGSGVKGPPKGHATWRSEEKE